MKKLHIYIILSVLIAGLISCGDNEDFSNLHQLTDEEIAEIARQDSIEEAQKNSINANLILEYSVNITVSQTLYDGTSIEIDIDQIAEAFGISEAELLSGIAGESGAPDVKGFAIDGTTYADYGSASTSGSTWGHWWDANGDVTEWGATTNLAVTYAEFDTETGAFSIGQYPGRLTDGQTITIIEALKYNEVRVAVVITINAETIVYQDPETPPAGDPEDLTTDIQLSKVFSDDYASVTYDVKEILRDAFKMTTYQIHNAIGSGELKLFQGAVSETDPAYTADAPGYWLKADGIAGEWSEGLVWCSIGHSETELYLYGGNHPDNGVAGTTVTTKYIATCNGGSVTFNITFNIE